MLNEKSIPSKSKVPKKCAPCLVSHGNIDVLKVRVSTLKMGFFEPIVISGVTLYRWPYKWVLGVISHISGVITPIDMALKIGFLFFFSPKCSDIRRLLVGIIGNLRGSHPRGFHVTNCFFWSPGLAPCERSRPIEVSETGKT